MISIEKIIETSEGLFCVSLLGMNINVSAIVLSFLYIQETKRSSLYGIISSRTDHNGRDSHTSSHHGGSGGKQPPDDYDEIDQIYDYVRGFAPLPKSAKGWQYIPEHGPHTNGHSEGGAATRGKETKGEDKKVFYFFSNRLISAGLEPVLSNTENVSCYIKK